MDEDFCPHLLGDLPKSACSVPYPYGCKAEKPDTKPRKKRKAQVSEYEPGEIPVGYDPVDAQIEAILAGKRCPRCGTPVDDHGFCKHTRELRHTTDSEGVDIWLNEFDRAEDSFYEALQSASGARRRMTLRLGRDEPSEYEGISRAQLRALEARKASGIEPSYTRPTVYDPEELPV